MGKQKLYIPNPNKISDTEQSFIKTSFENIDYTENNNIRDKYKGRMVSMSDSFYQKLNAYLKRNPTEGNRSSFIVRVVAEYIEKKI